MINLKSVSRKAFKDIETSKIYNEDTFYKAFSSDLKNAKREVIIESPFVSVRRSKEISTIVNKLVKKGARVKIYTRNSNHHTPQITPIPHLYLSKSHSQVTLSSTAESQKLCKYDCL